MRAAEWQGSNTFDARLRQLRGWAGGTPAVGQDVVGQIMTRKVRVASVHRHLAELIPLFGSTGHHDIPTVGLTARTSK
ncbi:hypothetical protein [Methylibium sp.]|jgi:CBS domain-containing membrane protein|uniref:hypothetical protein n=1 Tax=Methylibium sp. TaxID=2067992 RepID=UPI003D0E4C2D